MAEKFDVENIELKVDDENDEAVNVDIQQRTEEVLLEDDTTRNGVVPSAPTGDRASPSAGEANEDVVVISDEHMEHLAQAKLKELECSGEFSDLSEEHNAEGNKRYAEWVFVDVNKSTYEIRENLLVLSSVYGEQECCVIL